MGRPHETQINVNTLDDERNKTTKERGISMKENIKIVKPLGMDDSGVATRLLDKNFSPMCIRKFTVAGWPLFSAIICDLSMSSLDSVVLEGIKEYNHLLVNDLQSIRNFTGALSEKIINHYNGIKDGSVESVAIVFFYDKSACSSLWGDVMHHASCRAELYSMLNIFPHV
jgi:hypothetical protein